MCHVELVRTLVWGLYWANVCLKFTDLQMWFIPKGLSVWVILHFSRQKAIHDCCLNACSTPGLKLFPGSVLAITFPCSQGNQDQTACLLGVDWVWHISTVVVGTIPLRLHSWFKWEIMSFGPSVVAHSCPFMSVLVLETHCLSLSSCSDSCSDSSHPHSRPHGIGLCMQQFNHKTTSACPSFLTCWTEKKSFWALSLSVSLFLSLSVSFSCVFAHYLYLPFFPKQFTRLRLFDHVWINYCITAPRSSVLSQLRLGNDWQQCFHTVMLCIHCGIWTAEKWQ